MSGNETEKTESTETETTTTKMTAKENGNSGSVGNVETEYQEICSKNAWGVLYQHIRNECSNYNYTCNESKKPQTAALNRYRDVLPYDHTRIVLKKGPNNYINANIIQMEDAKRQYILTQGPLSQTTGHFWLMVWEQNSRGVIMLNKVIEKNQIKCHQYWPQESSSNKLMRFPDVGLKVEYISKTHSSDYVTTTLRLTDEESNESRDVLHFHYTAWPDFGVPQSPNSFLRFLADCRHSGALDQNVGPSIVHCSAGIGRSGTFCLVDTCLVLIEKNGINTVNVRDVLLEMRKSRMGLIQTADQLRFSYEAIIEGSKHLPLESLINMNTNNGVMSNNHYDVVCNSNNSSDEDDEPPPLPPPRGDSLNYRNHMNSNDVNNDKEFEKDKENNPLEKPLPQEPPGRTRQNNSADNIVENLSDYNSTSDGENSLPSNSPPKSPDSKDELRKRRAEKKERLETQVRDMKRRQKESEEWKQFKRSKIQDDSSEQQPREIDEELKDSDS